MTALADDHKFCVECGKAMFVSDTGTSHHVDEDSPDGIDHDADASHVPVADYCTEEDLGCDGTNQGTID
jgi:hypothetical protein